MTMASTRSRRNCHVAEDHTKCSGHKCMELEYPKKLLQKVKWSRDEDAKLKRLVEHYGTDNWMFLGNHFKKRTDVECQHRWQKVLNPELVKGPWSKEEDERVIFLVHKYGPKRWSIVAKHLRGRIGKQCRERWHNHLNPEVKKSPWTQEEDRIIYEAHRRLGNRWAEISKLLPGRTDNSIKNHWNSTMKRRVEHEGYLQDRPPTQVYKSTKPPVRRRRKPCSSSMDHLRSQGHFVMTVPTEMSGLLDGQVDSIPESSVSGQHADGYSSWSSSSLTEDGLTNSPLGSLEDQSMEKPHHQNHQHHRTESHHQHQHHCYSIYTPSSPTKYLVLEASAVLSSLQTIPEFQETLELIDSDPVAWSLVANFGLREMASPLKTEDPHLSTGIQGEEGSYHFDDDLDMSDLSKNSSELVPALSRTPPSFLKTGRRGEEQSGEQSPACECNSTSFLDSSASSPKSTPVKVLPFSPSQFLNACGGDDLNLDDPALTSTPVCRHRHVNTTTPLQNKLLFRTPKVQKAILLLSPLTPTPFKNSMTSQNRTQGPLKMMPQSVSLENDIREDFSEEEAGVEILLHEDSQTEDCYWKHEIQGESLLSGAPLRSFILGCEELGSSPEAERPEGCFYLPHQALSIALRREGQNTNPALLMNSQKLHYPGSVCSGLSQSELNGEWEAVVFGKTDDQMTLTEQARMYLSSNTPCCAQRALVL